MPTAKFCKRLKNVQSKKHNVQSKKHNVQSMKHNALTEKRNAPIAWQKNYARSVSIQMYNC